MPQTRARTDWIARTFAAAALWLIAGAARAGGLGVSPILLEFDGQAQARALWLSNAGDQVLHGQVRTFRWTQEQGEDRLTPTRDIVLSPPMLELAPGQQQLVRVIRTMPFPPTEQAYRILVNELPSTAPGGGLGLNLLMEFSVPIFVGKPGTLIAPDWSLHRERSGMMLYARNAGGTRAQVSALELLDGNGKRVLYEPGLYGYVLAGSERHWKLELPPGSTPESLRARINGEPIRAQIRADNGAP